MNVSSDNPSKDAPKARSRNQWNWTPPLPLASSPISSWPIHPKAYIAGIVRGWLPISEKLIIVGISVATWAYLSPSLEHCREMSADWIAYIFVRNLVMFTVLAGGLHLYLYVFRGQRDNYRYDLREFAKNSPRFTFKNQVLDNMFWSLASCVPIWTAWEVALLWAYANGYLPSLLWQDNPVWFVALFVLIPLFGNIHFYLIHRILHWQPLFRTVHHLHHHNINVGPWSGMSMHPIEHMVYFSSVLIHLLVASHPIHIIFNLQLTALTGPTSHSGFEKLTIGAKSKAGFRVGDFFHQLHHRYFECNYGDTSMPIDQWLGSFNDGTPEARTRTREHMQRQGIVRS